MDYTDSQLDAINHLDGNLQVIACAGVRLFDDLLACDKLQKTIFWRKQNQIINFHPVKTCIGQLRIEL
jgi:hypothetical protein